MTMKMHLSKSIHELTEQKKEKPALYKALADFSGVDTLTREQRDYCEKKITGYLDQINHFYETPNNYIFIASLLANKFSVQLGITYLRKIIPLILKPDLRHQLFWYLVRLDFIHGGDSTSNLFSAYLDMANAWKFDIPTINYSSNFDCVILTSQLLADRHAPTADTFGYFKILRNSGFNPLIINTLELPRHCSLPLINPFIANSSIYPPGLAKKQLDGIEISIFTPDLDMPNPTGLGKICAVISRMQPKFIMCVGGYSILQERIGAEYQVIIMPLSNDLSLSQTCTSVLTRKLDDNDRKLLARFSIDESRILEGCPYNYELPVVEAVNYEREQFALTCDDFIACVVGNRLDQELDNNFILFLKNVIDLGKNIKLLFVGALSPQVQARLHSMLPDTSTRFLHYCPDLVNLYKICDLYINPPRKGGGSSAAYCLAAGVPVFSTRYGDVSYLLPDCFLMDTLDEMHLAIRGLLVTVDRQPIRTVAADSFSKISNRADMVHQILNKVGVVDEKPV